VSKPGVSKDDLNIIKSNIASMSQWKIKKYHNIERIEPKTVAMVGEKNVEFLNAYNWKMNYVAGKKQKFEPIFSSDGSFNLAETFSIEKIAVHKQYQLKEKNDVNIFCSCGADFVLYANYKAHIDKFGCDLIDDFKNNS
jgi:hypothetical protein